MPPPSDRAPKNALAGQRAVEEATLTAKVPAKNEYAVILGNAKKDTKVTINLQGR